MERATAGSRLARLRGVLYLEEPRSRLWLSSCPYAAVQCPATRWPDQGSSRRPGPTASQRRKQVAAHHVDVLYRLPPLGTASPTQKDRKWNPHLWDSRSPDDTNARSSTSNMDLKVISVNRSGLTKVNSHGRGHTFLTLTLAATLLAFDNSVTERIGLKRTHFDAGVAQVVRAWVS